MKKSWFHYSDCTTEEAEMLMREYRSRGVQVERNLNKNFKTWTVSALLPELSRTPRTDRRYQNRFWR
ncbi:MAG: hypothetical protein LBN41_04365 [Enterobacteriaceae bacterium]|jgi:hypothetical protein|nr:hypothetical protein [Enterobacteriaceae bacterium]